MPSYTQHDTYEEITLAADEWHEINIGTGESFENKLIDCSASGAHVQVHADGGDWTIRNVGITGRVAGDPGNSNGGVATMTFAVDSGSTATVENLYMGDGCEPDSDGVGWASGYFVHRHHEGTLTVRNVNLQEFANNGMYASAAGYPSDSYAEGAVHIEEVYVRDACISGIRPGSPDSYVDTARIYQQGNGPVNTNGSRWRGVWTWYHGGMELRNVHIDTTEAGDAAIVANANAPSDAVTYVIDSEVDGYTNAPNGSIDYQNVGSNPTTAEPDYVPPDALSAADGSFAGDTGSGGGGGGTGWTEVSAPDALRIRTPNGIENIPTYKPSELATPALTFTVPDGSGGKALTAARLADPTSDPSRAIRINTPNGIRAIATDSAEVLADFETDWPGDWTDDTSGYTTTSGLVGDTAIENTGQYAKVAKATATTTRDATYTVRVVPNGSQPRPWLLTHVNTSTNANADCYAAAMQVDNNRLRVLSRSNDSTAVSGDATVSLSTGTEYLLALDVSDTQIRARVFDTNQTELASTGWLDETYYTDGYPGVYTGGSDGFGTVFDHIEKRPLGTL